MELYQEAIEKHRQLGGKLETVSKMSVETSADLSLAYTPGVAGVCEAIHKDPKLASELTLKKNTVAVLTDGSAVLGLGNIGPEAALPVMEGKAILFKKYAGIDAFPICLNTQDTDEIIKTARLLAPTFAGINLEDISAPRCFEIEDALQDLGIPVFHDDQHGTAIVVLAALLNAAKISGKNISDLEVVINGAGAAGVSIVNLLQNMNVEGEAPLGVKNIIVCDTKGIINQSRNDINNNPAKQILAQKTNKDQKSGSLRDALLGSDVFIGVSVGNLLTEAMIQSMNAEPIIFALANPIPEIMPELAKAAGASVVATGRSDFANQVNNVLAFPGIFRGALDAKAPIVSHSMKIAAARAIAGCVSDLSADLIIPNALDTSVGQRVGEEVARAFEKEKVPVL